MNILIPIAGKSPFFPPEEFAYPRPLIEIGGRPMIAWVIDNLKTVAKSAQFFFITSTEDAVSYSYEKVFSLLTDGLSKTITLGRGTGGALCSCLDAIDNIPFDEPLIIANSDQLIDAQISNYIDKFQSLDADGGVITFDSIHPRWSYVQIKDDGRITYAAEKSVISKNAIAGFYYFKKAGDFFESAQSAILYNEDHNGQFYISSSLNELVLAGKKIYAFNLPNERYYSFYHPKQIESFERACTDILEKIDARRKIVQVLIPAAGNGSRFVDAGYKDPKPFIDVVGLPMIERVRKNLGVRNAKTTVILRQDHIVSRGGLVSQLRNDGVEIVAIDKLTEGTACTVLHARGSIDNDKPLLIANSDQLIDIDINDMIDDCFERDLDGSILVFKDPEKKTKWSFAKLGDGGMVVQVAEKAAISDLATVGIYFFRRGMDFVRSAIDMIAQNDRINNEFYTCPVYNYAIKNGLKIGVYEIEKASMHGIGTPDDLNLYMSNLKVGA